jgi:hypothetical protein
VAGLAVQQPTGRKGDKSNFRADLSDDIRAHAALTLVPTGLLSLFADSRFHRLPSLSG